MGDLETNLAELLKVSAERALADELGRAIGDVRPAVPIAIGAPLETPGGSTGARDIGSEVISALQASKPARRDAAAWAPADETKPSDQIVQLSRSEQAPTPSAPSRSAAKASGSEAASATSTVVDTVLDGMGLGPVLRGLLSLFGGREEDPAPPLPRYSAPGSVRFNAGIRNGAMSPVAIDYGQGGEPREIAGPTPSVVVNVNAMDTQSFLDRSDDIAQAVKRALLESHSLNDVLAEL